MNPSRGFVSLALVLAIVVGIVVLGGAGRWVTQENQQKITITFIDAADDKVIVGSEVVFQEVILCDSREGCPQNIFFREKTNARGEVAVPAHVLKQEPSFTAAGYGGYVVQWNKAKNNLCYRDARWEQSGSYQVGATCFDPESEKVLIVKLLRAGT